MGRSSPWTAAGWRADVGTFVCFGEALLRLNAPGKERLLQTRALDVFVGGAEANVAVSLAQFGHTARFVSTLPDTPLGEGALSEFRRFGVDVSKVRRAEGRMGLYFMTSGAVRRPSEIIYDRAGSAFAAAADGYDWPAILAGADWLHVSGVTPAIGPIGSDGAKRAVAAAVAAGVKVSFDGNYRGHLWKEWNGDAPTILHEILSAAHIAFVNEKDIGLILRRDFASRADAYAAAFATYPRLAIIAATTRKQHSVDDHEIDAEIVTRADRAESRTYALHNVVDRIGGGDAFAAGILHGVDRGMALKDTVEFAAAAAAIKHSIPGDFSIVSPAEVEAAMSENGLDVKR
jgi:2-dehydro-3-deoxygluconokinase